MKQIKSVEVTYEDGTTERWDGRGSMNVVRTPAEAQGRPVLQDSDLSFLQAVLVFDRGSVTT